MSHMLWYPLCPTSCTREDLLKGIERVIDVAAVWVKKEDICYWYLLLTRQEVEFQFYLYLFHYSAVDILVTSQCLRLNGVLC